MLQYRPHNTKYGCIIVICCISHLWYSSKVVILTAAYLIQQGAPSTDGPWTTLRKHDNDGVLSRSSPGCAAWAVEEAEPFQVFRIFQCGLNQNGNRYLLSGGIELYGALTEET